jgi:chromatin structure-remodeling complex subunit RSC3/30
MYYSQLCFIGLPSAGVLAQELLRRLQARSSTSPSNVITPFPRSEVIQNLSVFASHLDSSLNVRDANHDIALKGLNAIRRVLDHVLSDDHNVSLPSNYNNDTNIDSSHVYDHSQDGHTAEHHAIHGGDQLLISHSVEPLAPIGLAPPAVPGWFSDDVNGMEFMTWLDNLDWAQESLLSYN